MTKAKSYKSRQNPDVHYIDIDNLPDDQREPFQQWIMGQTQPVVDERGDNADLAYAWDYDHWYDYWMRGEEAPKEEAQDLQETIDATIEISDIGDGFQKSDSLETGDKQST